jgi:hypothetical protein
MKNRQLMYILIPSVLLIWGLIIFKIIKQIHHAQKPATELSPFLKVGEMKGVIDTSSLLLNYRDPFLHGVVRSSSSSQSYEDFNSNNTNLTTAKKPPVNFPITKYSGLVINYKNRHKLGLIKIENKDFLAKEGELVAGERIIRLYTDSVIVSYNKTKKTFLRN